MHFARFKFVCIITTLVFSSGGFAEANYHGDRPLRLGGIVAAITENSTLILTDLSFPARFGQEIEIRQWALDISPEVLEVLTLGRKVDCLMVGETTDYWVGDCSIEIEVIEKYSTFSYAGPNRQRLISLRYASTQLSLGQSLCSEEDAGFPNVIWNGLVLTDCDATTPPISVRQ